MSDVRRLAAATVVAALCLVGVSSCEDDGADTPAPTASPTEASTPLTDFATDALVVKRDAFCSGVDPAAVEEALGSEPDASSSYGNGEPARVTTGLKDVAHEFACAWQGADGALARAWVFAPPITVVQARNLAAAARTAPGCGVLPGAPAFGRPSTGAVCRADGTLEASYRGLFGDAWLACSLAVPAAGADPKELADRAGRWCVTVAEAASGSAEG